MYHSNSNNLFPSPPPSPPKKSPPKPRSPLGLITFPKGRILWHARFQSSDPTNQRRNVMKSPDYLFTSPQMSQALLHGVYMTNNSTTKIVELTKLRVREPLILLNFKSSKNQVNYARTKGVNLRPFGTDDIKLIKYICAHVPDIDGYRAVWDQDQVTVCAKTIKKLERVSVKTFIPSKLPISSYNIQFAVNVNKKTGYYTSLGNKKPGRRLVKSVKNTEKKQAIERKLLRVRTFGIKKPEVSPTRIVFKRPTLRRKK